MAKQILPQHPPAQIVVFPRMSKQPIDDRPGLRELADVVSYHLFNCNSLCLSTGESRIVVKHVQRLLDELDKQRAS